MRWKGDYKAIQPGKRTTVAVGSTMADRFVPGWDSKPGPAQHTTRLDERIAMGEKKTPMVPGVLKRS